MADDSLSMADDQERIVDRLEHQIRFLKLALEDTKVQERLKELLETEMEFQAYLEKLENEKVSSREETFGQKAMRLLKLGWKDWIRKIFEKLNSIITSVIPGLGGRS